MACRMYSRLLSCLESVTANAMLFYVSSFDFLSLYLQLYITVQCASDISFHKALDTNQSCLSIIIFDTGT